MATKSQAQKAQEEVKNAAPDNIDPRTIKLGHEVTVTVGEDNDTTEHTYPSKSMAIVELDKMGLSRGDIAKKLNIRYQFVYNVLSRHGRTNASR